MFVTYNLEHFGKELKKIRTSLGFSQAYVQEIVGVSIDTIRKIESGRVVPRYDTLELLSVAYKEDLLDLLKNSRSNKFLMEYHDELDYIITCYERGAAANLKEKLQENFSQDDSHSMVNPREFDQFLIFVEVIDQFHTGAANSRSLRDELVDALRLTIPNYRLRGFRRYKYTYIEFRILLLISLLIAREGNFAFSNDILYYILDEISDKKYSTKYIDYLIINVYFNIAYNFHRMDNHAKALEVANAGIAFCLEKKTNHALYMLYYRKGVALYLLNQEDYMDSIITAFYLLKAVKIPNLLEEYRKITQEKYGITVPSF
ncbi:MAG: helix-turn-helix domain-containing protein [Bacillota bacterium]|jgi:transcriptional regulator with XRE-family HTH domain